MAFLRSRFLRRTVTTALLSLVALAFLPGVAGAAQPATLRLVGIDPAYSSTTVTMPDGTRIASEPGLFRLRITPAGGTAVERPGFCVDELHVISRNVNYAVSLRTAADDPRLSTARYAEAGWLIQQAESLIAVAPTASRGLEAGALQTAVWQLTDQAREIDPTSSATLNARTAALRALAAGRSIGGPVTITPAMSRGCAGRSSVALALTGRPGSTATLAVTGGTGTVSPAEVRFGADGTAQAAVSSSTPGTVSVTARSEGGTLTRIARSSGTVSTPQETMVLMPQSYSASASVVFDDCPVIPFEDPATPTTPTTPNTPVAPLETPGGKPSTPATPAQPAPRRPTQAGPRFTVTKKGPASVRAGQRARYTITVSNRSGAALRDLTVTDDLPAGMSLAGIPTGSRLRGGDVVWTLGSLKAGGTRTLHVDVRLDADISGRRCNRVSVTDPGTAGGTGTGTARLTRTATSCTMVKAVNRQILPAVTA
jgi:uncharacterized repeat protein (TIGR01451 family)